MRAHFKQLQRKYLYNEETHRILNLFTLEIEDKEISREYELFRIQRFNELFWPLIAVFAIQNALGWINFALGNGLLE
jgi:hypothetical protein